MKKLLLILCLSISCFAQLIDDTLTQQPVFYPYQLLDEDYYVQEFVSLNSDMIDTATVIIKELQKNISDYEAHEIATLLYKEHLAYAMDYSFILAIAAVETRFKHRSVSWAGARGLMQMLPSTFVYISKKYGYNYRWHEVNDLHKNVQIGTKYLNMLYTRYDGNLDYVSAGYNGGPGTADRYIKRRQGKYVRVPRETLNYVKKVNEYYRVFKQRLNE